MTSPVKVLAQFLLLVGCFYFLFSGIDQEMLREALRKYDSLMLSSFLLYPLATIWLMGKRIVHVSVSETSVRVAVNASLSCAAINNLLPAKMGEVFKIFYLWRHGHLTMGDSVGVIFWERLSDLIALFCLLLMVSALWDQQLAVTPLALFLLAAVAFLMALRARYDTVFSLLGKIPFPRVRNLALQLFQTLRQREGMAFFFPLISYTALIWILHVSFFYIALHGLANIDLTLSQAFIVCTVSTVGLVMPSTPGGLGVFETAMVLTLSWFYVDRESALMIALVIHAIQFVPTTLLGLIVIAKSGIDLKSIRQKSTVER